MDPRRSRSRTYSLRPSDASSNESWIPPPASAPGPSTASRKPPTLVAQSRGRSPHRRRSARTGSRGSGRLSEERAREATAILKDKPWLVDFWGDNGTLDSPPAADVTEMGIDRLAEPTASPHDTFAPPPVTPPPPGAALSAAHAALLTLLHTLH